MTATADGWNAFWYTPADPTLLGLIRTLTGLMLLYTHAVWGLVLHDFFGPDAWISRELAGSFQSDQFAYSLWWLRPAALALAGVCHHDARAGSLYGWAVDADHGGLVARGRDLVRQPGSRGACSASTRSTPS